METIKVNVAFLIGSFVYAVSDPDQVKGIVTGILITPLGVEYRVSTRGETLYYYEIELSTEKTF